MTCGPVYTGWGGDAEPAPTCSALAFTWPNYGETQFLVTPTGEAAWMAPDQPVYLRDGTNEGMLIVVQVGAEDPESPGIQIVELLNVGPNAGTSFGATTIYGGVGP